MLKTMPRHAAHEVMDFTRKYLERALGGRRRYRYVHPRVTRLGTALYVQSPCCSRNVDASGGLIDIALLCPLDACDQTRMAVFEQKSANQLQTATPLAPWRLYARDHAQEVWVLKHEGGTLDELIDLLCQDRERIFWP